MRHNRLRAEHKTEHQCASMSTERAHVHIQRQIQTRVQRRQPFDAMTTPVAKIAATARKSCQSQSLVQLVSDLSF